jgi:hypothetical protein
MDDLTDSDDMNEALEDNDSLVKLSEKIGQQMMMWGHSMFENQSALGTMTMMIVSITCRYACRIYRKPFNF